MRRAAAVAAGEFAEAGSRGTLEMLLARGIVFIAGLFEPFLGRGVERGRQGDLAAAGFALQVRLEISRDAPAIDLGLHELRMAEEAGGTTGYQTLIKAALREYLDGKAPKFEETLRRTIREELKSSAA